MPFAKNAKATPTYFGSLPGALGLMSTVLNSAHTWFLESYQQRANGTLDIYVVEGIKGPTRLPVEIGDQTLGPHFPVTIEAHSQCAIISFEDVRGVFTYPESYDAAKDQEIVLVPGKFIQQAERSSFRAFVTSTTTAIDDWRGEFWEWFVFTEDQIFQVVAGKAPDVHIDDRTPDFTIERGRTWSAR